ncbi:hybrid sensor histidine kinase/response regulator [Baaleninema sp.]|uniref:hybrid sensor histidine kinase/response regulator n=1 Tax=Baaleninema sp. TaxID=3101197 RepID=UPI003CFF41FA
MSEVKPPVKILIVEDELIAAANIARHLEKRGYVVTAKVSSGEKALNQVVENPPDLVLMDVHLRGSIDGIQTAARLRETTRIPVVYITAYADDDTIERAKHTEPYGYLVKPFKPQDIYTTIEMALQKYRSEEAVRQALDRAQQLNDLKTQTLSMAAHDLRTPLTSILGSFEVLKYLGDRLSPEKKDQYFDRIKASVCNMNALIDELLLANKLETGRLPFHPKPMDVLSFCHMTIDRSQAVASPQHHLVLDASPNLENASVCLDETLLRHILANLLSNAVKYSPQGGTVTLGVSLTAEGVQFRVSDEGIGIPESNLPKLFEMFSRAENVGDIAGTGLGLHIVKQTLDLHGGSIAVESREGVGSTFTVTLPNCDRQRVSVE